jgi:hypothetical protein
MAGLMAYIREAQARLVLKLKEKRGDRSVNDTAAHLIAEGLKREEEKKIR